MCQNVRTLIMDSSCAMGKGGGGSFKIRCVIVIRVVGKIGTFIATPVSPHPCPHVLYPSSSIIMFGYIPIDIIIGLSQ